MYGHSCGVVGRGGVGPPRFGGASLCWGRSVTTHTHRSVGIPQVRWVHLHCPTKALVAAADGEQRVQGFGFPRAPDVGVVRVVPPGVRVGAWVV